jgi:hypothetical protein
LEAVAGSDRSLDAHARGAVPTYDELIAFLRASPEELEHVATADPE